MSLFQHVSRINDLSSLLSPAKRRIHFLGILGVSMSALAEHLATLGHTVTGSDSAVSKEKRAYLSSLGICTDNAMKESNIAASDLVVRTLAISDENKDCVYARSLGIPIYSRPELLGAIMKGYRQKIGVSGTHGKSTTTAIIDRILCECDLSPTVFSGAQLTDSRVYRRGGDEIFLYEACEYREAFLAFCPDIAVILGIELDHTDYYKSTHAIEEAFFASVKSCEWIIISNEYESCRHLIKRLGKRAVSFGKASADYTYLIKGSTLDGTLFTLTNKGESEDFYISAPGEYNVKNATAAIIVADLMGISRADVKSALAGFFGISRRLEHLGKIGTANIYYDYAHHPTELDAVIGTLLAHYKTLTVIFRPHTYTRTRDLWDSFTVTLGRATHSLILDIYPARESAIVGISAEALADGISGGEYIEAASAARHALSLGDDAILLAGAGDVENIKNTFAKMIKENSKKEV